MNPKRHCLIFIALALTAVGCTDGGDAICDEDELTSALAAAFEGDTVLVGRCEVAGSFTVYPGVTLAGVDRDASVLKNVGTAPVVRLEAGAQAPRVTNLTVNSNGGVGIVSKGSGGTAAVEAVSVVADKGIGMGVEGLDSVTINDLSLTGPWTASTIIDIPQDPEPANAATHGLVLLRVSEASLEKVSVSGFGSFGALFVDSTTEWTDGGATKNASTGLMVHAGVAKLRNLSLCGTFRDKAVAYGGVFTACAQVETDHVTVCDGELGLLHDGDCTQANHTELDCTDNSYTAVWLQKGAAAAIADATIERNKLGGVVLMNAGETTIDGGTIAETEEVTRVWGVDESIQVGDGIQVVEPRGAISVRDVILSNNQRVGLLLDLQSPEEWDRVSLSEVEVEGTGESLGAIGQGTSVPEGWDASITRDSVTAENDEAHREELRVFHDEADTSNLIDSIDTTEAFMMGL